MTALTKLMVFNLAVGGLILILAIKEFVCAHFICKWCCD